MPGRTRAQPLKSSITAWIGLLSAGLIASALAAAPARAQEAPLWEAGAGVAVINFPHYRGSDQRRTWLLPFPYVVYRGEFLQVDEQGLRGLFFKSERTELNLSVSGSIPIDSNDNHARRGMPDLDPTLEIGPTLNFALWRSPDAKTSSNCACRCAPSSPPISPASATRAGCSSPTSVLTARTSWGTRDGISACWAARSFPIVATTAISTR